MARQKAWDIYGVALLLDYLVQSIDGKLTRKEAVRRTSIDLRMKAIHEGMEIDDIYRNEAGITF